MRKKEAPVALQIAMTTNMQCDKDFIRASQMLYELLQFMSREYEEHKQTYNLHDNHQLFSIGECSKGAQELLHGSDLETLSDAWRSACVILERYEL